MSDYLFTDVFNVPKSKRTDNIGIFGYLTSFDKSFLIDYYSTAVKGALIEDGFDNPDSKDIEYFTNMCGSDFKLDTRFFNDILQKWLPRLNGMARSIISVNMFDALNHLRNTGKTISILKNTYVKYMCWFYFKVNKVISQLGNDVTPKILYDGKPTIYELAFLKILQKAGCDILMVFYDGGSAYKQVDTDGLFAVQIAGATHDLFPAGFSISQLKSDMNKQLANKSAGIGLPIEYSSNSWLNKEDLLNNLSVTDRGTEYSYYNMAVQINGVDDREHYTENLFKLSQKLKQQLRRIVIINGVIQSPSSSEIATIMRSNGFNDKETLLRSLVSNIVYVYNNDIQTQIRGAFLSVMMESKELKLNRVMNDAVYVLCWIKKYMSSLLGNWKDKQNGVFFKMGPVETPAELAFIKILAKLPVDVVVFNPDNKPSLMEGDFATIVDYKFQLNITVFPENASQVKVGTVAYHAERDLDTMIYTGTGIYRDQQFRKATPISLHTMYEEIAILWDQEVRFRPNFSENGNEVVIPTIISKICGTFENIETYWNSIRRLATDDTLLYVNTGITMTKPTITSQYAVSVWKNNRLDKKAVKKHADYKYGILREEIQDYMLDKLELLLQQKTIDGIGTNGTEYTVIQRCLDLPKDILKKIQSFDFTQKNPKIVMVNTKERILSIDDSIILAYLSFIGFDIVFFVPTGYRCIEKYFTVNFAEEHQIGDYQYDLIPPDLTAGNTAIKAATSWRNKIFGRKGK